MDLVPAACSRLMGTITPRSGADTAAGSTGAVLVLNAGSSSLKFKLFELLDPSRIDVELTEEFQLDPEQSTSAIVVHHPEARYFNIE